MSASEDKREGFWNLKQTVCYQHTRVRPSKKGWDVALNPFAAHPMGSEGAGLSRFWAIPVAAQADVSPVLLQSVLPSHSPVCPSPLQGLPISSLLSSVPQPELPAPQLCKTLSATQGCVVEHCPLPKKMRLFGELLEGAINLGVQQARALVPFASYPYVSKNY